MYNTPLTGRGSPDFMEELAFGLDLTLYEGSDSPFDGLAYLDSSTAKTEIARAGRASTPNFVGTCSGCPFISDFPGQSARDMDLIFAVLVGTF